MTKPNTRSTTTSSPDKAAVADGRQSAQQLKEQTEAQMANVIAPVRARIEHLAEQRRETAVNADRAMRALRGLWARPVGAQRFADLVVSQHVDKLARNFFALAGVERTLAAFMRPAGGRPAQPVNDNAALVPPTVAANSFQRGGTVFGARAQTNLPLNVADLLVLEGAPLGDFERMAEVSAGALLGVSPDAAGAKSLGNAGAALVAMASAIAFFGGDAVRRAVHGWALAKYQKEFPESASGGQVGDMQAVVAEIEAAQAEVGKLQAELDAIDDELAELPVIDFDRNGLAACEEQRNARVLRNLPPVYGPSKQ